MMNDTITNKTSLQIELTVTSEQYLVTSGSENHPQSHKKLLC